MKTKSLAIILLALWLWLVGVSADTTVFQPTTYVTPASLTIQTGVPLLGVWDFTGATVIGVGGGTGGGGDALKSETLDQFANVTQTLGALFSITATTALNGGSFSGTSSGTNTGDQTTVTGNAGSATILQNARLINGVSFNGSADITVPAKGSTLTDTVPFTKGGTGLTSLGLALQVLRVNSAGTAYEFATISVGGGDALTSNNLDQFANVTQTGVANFAIATPASVSGSNTGDQTITLTGPVTGSGNSSFVTSITDGSVTVADMASVATGTVFYRKTAGSGPPEVFPLATLKTDLGLTGTNTGDQTTITGNAGSATVLQTARNINGVPFNGSADITIGVPFTGVTGLLQPNQIDRTVDSTPQIATVVVPPDDPKKTTASGTLTTLAFTGGSGANKEWKVDVDVTLAGNIAFTDGTTPLPVRRLGATGTVTSAFFGKGYHELRLRFIAGTDWVLDDSLVAPEPIIWVALSDETTPITTGVAKVTCRAPFAFTATGVRASLTTASTTGIPTVDINEAGVSILSTKLTIDATEKTSTTAAAAAVISDTAVLDDSEITFDIDTAGANATGLKVCVYGYR